MLIYRTTPYDDNYLTYLQKLGEDNWIYCGPLGDKLVFRKEEKRAVTKKQITASDDFDEFWNLYPKERRKMKKQSREVWARMNEKQKTLAIDGLKRYKIYWKRTNQDLNFISLAYYFIKNERYMDEGLDTPSTSPVSDKIKEEIQEESRVENEKRMMNQKLQELKNKGLWDEWYNKAKSELPEGQQQYEALIIARIKMRLNT